MEFEKCTYIDSFLNLGHKYQAGFGVIILGQNPQTFMIPAYSTTVLYDDPYCLYFSLYLFVYFFENIILAG